MDELCIKKWKEAGEAERLGTIKYFSKNERNDDYESGMMIMKYEKVRVLIDQHKSGLKFGWN